MKRMTLGTSSLEVPVIAAGCMRINALDEEGTEDYINKCMELGMNFFEHADIYGNGKCESLFAEAFEERSSGVRISFSSPNAGLFRV